MRSEIITFRSPRPTIAAVDLRAAAEGRSRSQMIRILIERALNSTKPPERRETGA